MKKLKATLFLFFIIFLMTATSCSENNSEPLWGEEPAVGHKDEIKVGNISVDEKKITANLKNDSLFVNIPVYKDTNGKFYGVCQIQILDLDGNVIVSQKKNFEVDGKYDIVKLEISDQNIKNIKSNEKEALYVLSYKLKWEDNILQGYKSLFFTLPKIDLKVTIPDAVFENSKPKVRFFVIDPISNKPIPDKEISLEILKNEEQIATVKGKTDDTGTVVLEIPVKEKGEYKLQAKVEEGGYVFGEIEDEITAIREAQVLLTTDKPFYQPGQNMDIRVLALRKPELNAVQNEDVTIEVYDGKGNMVFRKYSKTNEFGIAGARFKIGNTVNQGHYEVKAIFGDTQTSKTVTVKYYSLPKFKIKVDLDKPFYTPGDTIKGVIEAKYFYGKPIKSGSVKITASAMDIGFSEFATVTGKTNDDGIYEFSIKLSDYFVGVPLEGGNALVNLEISVTDQAEHEEVINKPVTVAEDAINITAISEAKGIVPEIPNKIYLFATSPLGSELSVTFDAEFQGEKLEVKQVSDGIGLLTVTPEVAEEYSLKVTAQDTDGNHVEKEFKFTNKGGGTDGIIVRTDKAIYRAGEVCKVRIYTSGGVSKVFVDIIQNGQTVLTKTVDIKEGKGGFDLDLDQTLVGDLIIEGYLITESTEIIRDSRLIFVKNAKSLVIEMTKDKETYAPGEDATLTFKVKDASGNPQVSALGIQIVDEAVYALTEIKPGLLETYFTIQEELQKPKYEVHGVSFDLGGIINSPEEDETNQTKAEMAFSALSKQDLIGNEESSFKKALSELVPLIKPYFNKEKERIANIVADMLNNGYLDYNEVVSYLKEQKIFYDFWGNLYKFDGEDPWNLKIMSAGPDEEWGTADDIEDTIDVYEDMMLANEGAAEDAMLGFPGEEQPAGGKDFGANGSESSNGAKKEVKIRKYFPETLYFNPSLITDENGTAQISLTMADSITEWRVTTLGSTKNGYLGSNTFGVTVFQDFFIDIDFPAYLTRNDEVKFPVAVYNYLPVPQDIEVEVQPEDWFELLGDGTQKLQLDANSVGVVYFPVKVKKVGTHSLTVIGYGTEMNDGVKRLVRVMPDGKEYRTSKSGLLKGDVSVDVTIPEQTIEGSQNVLVKIYPGIMAQAVEGLDSILKMPNGCFEQTTSSTWPNVLVLNYLKASNQINPEIEMKAEAYINQGYQRLLTFECTGGGFTWFGDPAPGNLILSAMGVMEFSDMSKVHDVDLEVIKRTVDFIMKKMNSDGSFHENQGSEFATVQYDDVKTTAFIAWALTQSAVSVPDISKTINYLKPFASSDETDIYSLALIANAFANYIPDDPATTGLLDKLANMAIVEEDSAHWKYEGQTSYYGGGNSTDIEVTALIVQAFLDAGVNTELAKLGINYLVQNKDSFGNWNTTHATILSLRALIKSLANKTEKGEGTVAVYYNNDLVSTIEITEENRNVFHTIELGEATGNGGTVDIKFEGTGNFMYQVVTIYYLPYSGSEQQSDIIGIDVKYDKTHLKVDDTVSVTATVTNKTSSTLDMVMIDLGLPPGFDLIPDKIKMLKEQNIIQKYEVAGKQLLIYLEKLTPNQKLEINYDLIAKFPVKAKTPESKAYLYYDEETKDEAQPIDIEVE